MSRFKRLTFLKVLTTIAWADGEVTQSELNILKSPNRMVYPMQREVMFLLQKKGVWRPVVKPFMIGKMAKLPFDSNQKSWIIIKPSPEAKYS